MDYFWTVLKQAIVEAWDLTFGAPVKRLAVALILAAVASIVYFGIKDKTASMRDYIHAALAGGVALVFYFLLAAFLNFIYVTPRKFFMRAQADVSQSRNDSAAEAVRHREEMDNAGKTAQQILSAHEKAMNDRIEALQGDLTKEKAERKKQVQDENAQLNEMVQRFKRLYSLQTYGKQLLLDCRVLSSDTLSEVRDGGLRSRSRGASREALKKYIEDVEKELEKFHKPYYPLILQKFVGGKLSDDEAIYATAKDRKEKLPDYIGTLSNP